MLFILYDFSKMFLGEGFSKYTQECWITYEDNFSTLTEINKIVEGSYERLISGHVTKISQLPSTMHRTPGRDTPDLKII